MIALSILARRQFMQVSTVAGLSLVVPARRAGVAATAKAARVQADSCIVVFLQGGPSQLETFDPKPDAPEEVRGTFGVTRTPVAGVTISDRLPKLARCQDRYAMVRTCQTGSGFSHHGGIYEAFTGFQHPSKDGTAIPQSKGSDHASFATLVGKLAPGGSPVLRCVQFPNYSRNEGILPGQLSGLLGPQYNPFLVQSDPARSSFDVPVLSLPRDMTPARLEERRQLLNNLSRGQGVTGAENLDAYQEQAFQLLAKEGVRDAFIMEREPATMRERYGRSTIGQSCLLARRLVEARVKMITVNTYQQTWDTHGKNFEMMDRLLPSFDQALSALLEDIEQRGLLKRTLVIAVGEFGRTPKINKDIGRDHWGNCYSALIAGGGVRGGLVLGQSDRFAAYPSQGRIVRPADLCATVYQTMGIDSEQEIQDAEGRPLKLTYGQPVNELFS